MKTQEAYRPQRILSIACPVWGGGGVTLVLVLAGGYPCPGAGQEEGVPLSWPWLGRESDTPFLWPSWDPPIFSLRKRPGIRDQGPVSGGNPIPPVDRHTSLESQITPGASFEGVGTKYSSVHMSCQRINLFSFASYVLVSILHKVFTVWVVTNNFICLEILSKCIGTMGELAAWGIFLVSGYG